MRKLWGRSNSSNVMKVVWLLDELALPFEWDEEGGPAGQMDAAYIAANPSTVLPTLQEDDFVLWESNAIPRYLAAAHAPGTPLWPGDLRLRASIDRWMDWQQIALTRTLSVIFVGLVRSPPEQRDMGAIGAAVTEAGRHWRLLEAHLARHPFIAGPDFTLADIAIGVHAHRWLSFMIARPELPYLRAWYRRLLMRPAYRKHCAAPMT